MKLSQFLIPLTLPRAQYKNIEVTFIQSPRTVRLRTVRGLYLIPYVPAYSAHR